MDPTSEKIEDGLVKQGKYILPPKEELLVFEDLSDYVELDPNKEADRKSIEIFWNDVFREDHISIEKTYPYRLLSGWRIVREMAYLKGYVRDDQLLFDSPELVKPNNWFYEGPVYFQRDSVVRGSNWCVAAELRGLPILPPLIKNRADLWKLKNYVKAVQKIIVYLQLNISSKDPKQRRFGTQGFTDLRTIHLFFPQRYPIMEAEKIIVDSALRKLVDEGQAAARDWVQDFYGITPYESHTVIRMARARAKDRLNGDLDEEKGMMVMKLEDLVKRSKKSFDVRTELQTYKLLYHVLGLRKANTKDVHTQFTEVVRKISKERPSPLLNPPSDEPQSVEYRVKEEDGDES